MEWLKSLLGVSRASSQDIPEQSPEQQLLAAAVGNDYQAVEQLLPQASNRYSAMKAAIDAGNPGIATRISNTFANEMLSTVNQEVIQEELLRAVEDLQLGAVTWCLRNGAAPDEVKVVGNSPPATAIASLLEKTGTCNCQQAQKDGRFQLTESCIWKALTDGEPRLVAVAIARCQLSVGEALLVVKPFKNEYANGLLKVKYPQLE